MARCVAVCVRAVGGCTPASRLPRSAATLALSPCSTTGTVAAQAGKAGSKEGGNRSDQSVHHTCVSASECATIPHLPSFLPFPLTPQVRSEIQKCQKRPILDTVGAKAVMIPLSVDAALA